MESNVQKRHGYKYHLKEFKKQLPYQIMVWPGIIFVFIFSYIPIYGILIAFKHYTIIDTMSSAKWVGLDNFKIVLGDKYFWQSVYNTLGISFLRLLIGFPIPILLALLIHQINDGIFKKFVQTVSYLPHFISWIVLGGMIISWLSTTGVLNQLLIFIGISAENKTILLNADAYWGLAVISDIWKEAGWGTIIYLAAMSGIDKTYYEAATVDGASKLRQIWSITLPLIKTIISFQFILTVSGLLGSNFDQTLVLKNTQNISRAEVISSYTYEMGMVQGDFSYATAVGLGISIVSTVLLLVTNVLTNRLNDESIL